MTRPISEDDAADYRRQDAEERERNRLIRMGQRGGPDAAEGCEKCGGTGRIPWWKHPNPPAVSFDTLSCPRCLGTGVQP